MAAKSIIDEIASGCLMGRARMLSRAVTAIYENELRPFGVKASQLNLLIAIAKAGPIRRGELTRYINLEPSTLTRNLAVMIERGWIVEVADKSDGRGAPLRLAPDGRALIEEIGPGWRRAQARTRSLLGDTAADGLAALSRTLALATDA